MINIGHQWERRIKSRWFIWDIDRSCMKVSLRQGRAGLSETEKTQYMFNDRLDLSRYSSNRNFKTSGIARRYRATIWKRCKCNWVMSLYIIQTMLVLRSSEWDNPPLATRESSTENLCCNSLINEYVRLLWFQVAMVFKQTRLSPNRFSRLPQVEGGVLIPKCQTSA